MSKKSVLVVLLFLAAIMPTVQALPTFKQGEEISLVQTCSNCTYNNITTITAPNSTIIVTNQEMTKDGVSYNYTLVAQENVGTYVVCGVGDLNTKNTVWCYDFEVTSDGYAKEVNNTTFITLALFSIMFFVAGFYLLFRKEEKHERAEL